MTSGRTVSRLSRILAMLPFVMARGGATVEELQERFGYTRSELARDLGTVFVCGLPGYGPGDLMEAWLEDDEVIVDAAEYFSNAPRLTSAEILTLLASGMAVLASGQAPAALRTAVDKLASVVLPDAEQSLVIDVEPAEHELVGRLRQAAIDSEVMSISYTSVGSEKTTQRAIEPWSVFAALGNWYVSGHCRLAKDRRIFRVDRIKTLAPTGETFTPPADPPPPGVAYVPSDDDVTATISLSPRARWVLDYYPVEVVAEGDDTTIEFSSSDALVAARLLLRLGSEGKLVAGSDVASRTRELASDILRRYRGQTGLPT